MEKYSGKAKRIVAEILRVLRQTDGGIERGTAGKSSRTTRQISVELANEVCPLAGVATAILRRFGE
jgi:hypothetical protein